MYIHEAITKAGPTHPCIYRKVWMDKAFIHKVVYPITQTGDFLLKVGTPNGSAFTQWCPTVGDLIANDWDLLYCPPARERKTIDKFVESLLRSSH